MVVHGPRRCYLRHIPNEERGVILKIIAATAVALAASALMAAPALASSAGSARTACHSSSGFPNGHCTPGATWSRVTQGSRLHDLQAPLNLDHPAPGELHRGAQAHPDRLYGNYAGSRFSSYEEDHLIPLELGGTRRQQAILARGAPFLVHQGRVEATLNHACPAGASSSPLRSGPLPATRRQRARPSLKVR